MSAVRLGAWTVAVGSMVLNVVLLVRGAKGSVPTDNSISTALQSVTRSPTPALTRAPQAPTDLPACLTQVATLERVATEKSEELRKVLPFASLFRLGEPNLEGAALLTPIVDRILAAMDAGGSPNHSLECRDVVCKLTIVEPAGTTSKPWMEALQRPGNDLRSHTNGMSFHATNPSQDPVTKEGLVESTVYLNLASAPAAGARGP
jgi:hypothetical protein